MPPGVVDGAPLLLAELEAAVPGQVEQVEARVVLLQQLLHTVRRLSSFFTNVSDLMTLISVESNANLVETHVINIFFYTRNIKQWHS